MRLRIASLLVATAAIGAAPATAEIIFDTLAAGNQYGNGANGGDGLAQSFTTTATASTVTSAILKLSNNYPQPPGNYSVSIWGFDTLSHKPTTQVASIYSGDMSNLSNSAAEVTYSGLNIALAPSTTYYMVVLTEPAAGGITWSTSAYDVGPFVGNTSQFLASYNHGAATWFSPVPTTTAPRIMQITATQNAVPEIDPAGMGSVVALLAGALGVLERRGRRMTS